MIADNTKKFEGRAGVYEAARPAYAEPLFDLLCGRYGFKGKKIADVGAGTGKFTRSLLQRGCEVYAVEPDIDMRRAAEERLAGQSGFHSVCGTDANTMLPAASVYAVTVAQAFHWFDAAAFRAECRRILYGKTVAIVYNSRTESALHEAVAAVNRTCCPGFSGFSGGITEQRISDFFGEKFEQYHFLNDVILDEEMFIKRNLSSSYAPRRGDAQFAEYVFALRKIFDVYARNGRLLFPMETRAYIGEP